MRRATLAVVVALVVLSGCGRGGTGTPQAIEANASQATVGADALSAAGYERVALERGHVNASGTLSIAGDVQMDLGYQVEADTWRAVYRPADGSAATLAVYSVPLAKPENVAARIDPLAERSLADVVALSQAHWTDVRDLRHTRNRTVRVLDTDATVRQYTGTATREDAPEDVVVFVTQVRHDGDLIRVVAVLPAGAGEWGEVRPLFEAVRH